MASSSRGFTALAILVTASLALLAGLLINKKDDSSYESSSILYCASKTSPSSITTLNPGINGLEEEEEEVAACFRVNSEGIFTAVLESESEARKDEKIIYINGYVLPGMIDSHGHILQYGEMLESVSLYDAESVAEIRTRILQFLEAHKDEGYGTREKWIRGIGWDQKYFGGVMPTAEGLGDDPGLKELYISLDRVDVHCILTSQKVLDLLPEPLPEPPPGGVIVTDPGPGVFCDNAMDAIIQPLAPKPDAAQKTRWFQTAMKELNKVGITGVGDAGMRPKDVSILESMAEKGELSIRVNVMLECAERNTYCPEEIRDLKLLKGIEGLGAENLILGGVKLFADGALGSWGAALLEPYSDMETSGTMLINETELTSVVKEWFDAGFQVNIHAIGDRANRAAVDAFEFVLSSDCEGCNDAERLRIEHAQIIHPDDQLRIGKMGIIPSIQPTHATSDMAYAEARLGHERLSHSAYRMASFFPSSLQPLDSKYRGPVLGSDFPVEPPNPFHGMYAAVTRLNPVTGTSPSGDGGWYPEESLSIEQALAGFTRNAAYGWFQEDKAGTIAAGKWADWVVVDRDIYEDRSGKSLRDVVVKETWMNGRKVYSQETALEDAGWMMVMAEAVQDPLAPLRELITAIRELIDALTRLVEALASLLRALTEFLERRSRRMVQLVLRPTGEL